MIEKKNQISNNHNTSNDGKKEEARKAIPVKRIPRELKPKQDNKPAQDDKPSESKA